MSLIPLLQEWSELEPERCNFVGGMIAIRGWTLASEEDLKERLVAYEILNAILEALDERGWYWHLGRVVIDGTDYYKAHIRFTLDENAQLTKESSPKPVLSTHSTAHILLMAYVEALAIAQEHNLPKREKEAPTEEDINLLLKADLSVFSS